MAGVRDRLAAALGEDDRGPDWTSRVEELLYDGETIRDTISVEHARVVVTSHRVLTITPDRDGPNFQQVDRPNVVGVATGSDGNVALLGRGIRWTVIGLLMVGAGVLIDFESIVGSVNLTGSGAGQVGFGGILGVVQGMLNLLRQLDVVLQVLGALGALLGVLVLGVYLLGRESTLVIRVAGDETSDLHLPRPGDSGSIVERLDAAIFPDDRATGGPSPDSDPLGEA
jgi:hypothetical protein